MLRRDECPGRRAVRRRPERLRVADEKQDVPCPCQGYVQSPLVGHEPDVGACPGAHRGDYNHVGLGALEGVHGPDTQALSRSAEAPLRRFQGALQRLDLGLVKGDDGDVDRGARGQPLEQRC